ncbi:hypothetical protein HOD29_04810 [archaeon]|jgi:hypothetical protein|nr:hypothetical protein [archaeon]
MKKLTSLLLSVSLAFSLSCNNNKYLEGTITDSFDKNDYLKHPEWFNSENKIDYIKGRPLTGMIIGTYIAKSGEENYYLNIVEEDFSKVDSILNALNEGTKIRFEKKPTEYQKFRLCKKDTIIIAKKGYWKSDEVKVIK